MDKNKLHKILSLKETIPYLNHSDFIQLSYTCKFINEYLIAKTRSKLTFKFNEKLMLDREKCMVFIKKWKNYMNLNHGFVNHLHANFRSKTYINILKFHLLRNLQTIFLENIQEIDVIDFNNIVYRSKALKSLRLINMKIIMKEVGSEDFTILQLPSTLVELIIRDIDIRLSSTYQVHNKMCEISNSSAICKDVIFAPEIDLTKLNHLGFGSSDADIVLLDYILDLTVNLETLTLWDSVLTHNNLRNLKRLSNFKKLSINASQPQFSLNELNRYIPKTIIELSLNYDFEPRLWDKTSLHHYKFDNLKKLTIQYNPGRGLMVRLITKLFNLRNLHVVGKPYNYDIDSLNIPNKTINELRLTYFQYSQMDFKIFRLWTSLKKITIDLSTPMYNYYIYFELCEMLTNWKYYTYRNSVQFWNMNKN